MVQKKCSAAASGNVMAGSFTGSNPTKVRQFIFEL